MGKENVCVRVCVEKRSEGVKEWGNEGVREMGQIHIDCWPKKKSD